MRRFFRIIIITFLIIILLFSTYSKYIRKDRITTLFGYGFLIVLTGSMEPKIEEGSLIIIKNKNEYKIGDIITFLEGNYFVTHRIIEKNNDNFITKGDKNNEKDVEISGDKILGKVIFSSLILGVFIRKYLKYVFILFTVFVVILNIFSKFKEKKESEKVKDK